MRAAGVDALIIQVRRYKLRKSAPGESSCGGVRTQWQERLEIKLKISDVPAFHTGIDAHRKRSLGPGTPKFMRKM